MNKQLTQVGLNRAMWIMLKRLLASEKRDVVIIHEKHLEMPNLDDAMKIQYDPLVGAFIFSLHKAKDNKNISSLIVPGRN